MQFVVIIPHFDDIDRLRRCLNALLKQDLSDTDIVVVDNATPKGLGQLELDFPAVRVITEQKKGAAAARNKGLAETDAEWIFLLDADCVPASNWIETARKIAKGGDCRITGGRIEVFDETSPPRTGAEAFETVFAFDQKHYIENKGFSATANLVAAASVFSDVGDFAAGKSEDLDWCRRATMNGYKLSYDPRLVVSHPTRSDWPVLVKKWRRLTDESFGLLPNGISARIYWALRGLLMPASVLVHLPHIWRNPRLTRFERFRAGKTLLRLRLLRMVWMITQSIQGKR